MRGEIFDLVAGLNVDYIVWQQDGAPAHKTNATRQYLDNRYNEWIGFNGTILWPARSPDLTPLDFFLWGTLKDMVYKERCNNIDELREKINEGVRVLNEGGTIINYKRSLLKRYTLCIAQNGGHIEHLL